MPTGAILPPKNARSRTNPETRQVTLAEGTAVEHTVKTLRHETAHIGLHHIDNVDKYRTHRRRMEVEAESVA